VKNRIFMVVLPVSIIMLLLSFGCARKALRIQPPQEPVKTPEKIEEAPKEEEVAIDYQKIELKLFDFVQVEQIPGLYNSYNPQFSTDERYIAFEVDQGTVKKIRIYAVVLDGSDQSPRFTKVKEVSLTDTSPKKLSDDLFEYFSECRSGRIQSLCRIGFTE
jgi:hypothetical protein